MISRDEFDAAQKAGEAKGSWMAVPYPGSLYAAAEAVGGMQTLPARTVSSCRPPTDDGVITFEILTDQRSIQDHLRIVALEAEVDGYKLLIKSMNERFEEVERRASERAASVHSAIRRGR